MSRKELTKVSPSDGKSQVQTVEVVRDNLAGKQKWGPLYQLQITICPIWYKQQIHFPTMEASCVIKQRSYTSEQNNMIKKSI